MDFHSLHRRDLQSLCKLNKIPANLTNVAMADALQALSKVEGIDAILAKIGGPQDQRTASKTGNPNSPTTLSARGRRMRTVMIQEFDPSGEEKEQEKTPATLVSRGRKPADRIQNSSMADSAILLTPAQTASRRMSTRRTTTSVAVKEEASEVKPSRSRLGTRQYSRRTAAKSETKQDDECAPEPVKNEESVALSADFNLKLTAVADGEEPEIKEDEKEEDQCIPAEPAEESTLHLTANEESEKRVEEKIEAFVEEKSVNGEEENQENQELEKIEEAPNGDNDGNPNAEIREEPEKKEQEQVFMGVEDDNPAAEIEGSISISPLKEVEESTVEEDGHLISAEVVIEEQAEEAIAGEVEATHEPEKEEALNEKEEDNEAKEENESNLSIAGMAVDDKENSEACLSLNITAVENKGAVSLRKLKAAVKEKLQAIEERKKRFALEAIDDNCIYSPGRRLQC
ncbi:uncharacterized protein LOC144708752 [Wolffia australiana]